MRSIISSSTAIAAATQRRAIGTYMFAGATGMQPSFTIDHLNKASATPNGGVVDAPLKGKKATPALTASATGSMVGYTYTDEDIFNPAVFHAVAAKTNAISNNYAYLSRYVIPALDKDFANEAVGVFDRFAKDADQVELFFRKMIRNFPATVNLLGSAAEIEAFEAAEGAKIPNNKLIVGRVNAKVAHKNIREEVVEFFATLIAMGPVASDAEVLAYALPIYERWMTESFFSRPYLWRMQEELLRSLALMPNPASPYEARVVETVLEHQIKVLLNGVADLPWANEEFSCPTRQGGEVSGSRMCAEAGMW